MPYANVNSPNGFIPIGLEGIKSPKRKRRVVDANRAATASASTAILSVGDAYTVDANGHAKHAGPADRVQGIVEAIELKADPTIMNANGPVSVDQLTAAMSGAILGIEDENVDFVVQADTFAESNQLGLFNLLDTVAPSTLFRQSRQSLNVSGGAGTQFRAIDIKNSPADNAYGAFAKVVVRLAQVV